MSREYESIQAVLETKDFMIAQGLKHGVLRPNELKDVDNYQFCTDLSCDPRLQQTAVNARYAEFLRNGIKTACREIRSLRLKLKGVPERETPVRKYLDSIAKEAQKAWFDFLGQSYRIDLLEASMDGRSDCENTGYWRGAYRLKIVIPSTWKHRVHANGLSYFINSGEKAFVLNAHPVDNILAEENDAQLFTVKVFGKLSESTVSSWMNRVIRAWSPEDGNFSEFVSDHPIMEFIRDNYPHNPPAVTPDQFSWSLKGCPAVYPAYMARSNLNGYVGSGMTAKAAIKLMDRRNVKGFIDQLRD
jgi:hypothetical protein